MANTYIKRCDYTSGKWRLEVTDQIHSCYHLHSCYQLHVLMTDGYKKQHNSKYEHSQNIQTICTLGLRLMHREIKNNHKVQYILQPGWMLLQNNPIRRDLA